MYNVALVGVTGLVGQTLLTKLEEIKFPIKTLKPLASKRSAGKEIKYLGTIYIVEELQEDSFKNIDLAFFCAGGEISRLYIPFATKEGAVVIDNSSYFRLHEDVGLVVPEVNLLDALKNKIIANPNCSTIEAIIPVKALYDEFGITRIQYTTYQATSGSGMKGLLDLQNTKKGQKPSFYPYDISRTCIPEIDVAMDNLYTKEEMKMVYETKKILHDLDLLVSATCVRVPVENAHAISIALELIKPFSLAQVRETLGKFPGIKVIDDLTNHQYPTSLHACGNDFVYVGRIRKDISSNNGLLLYVVADNIRKGAASNAVQIAEEMIKKGWL